MKITRLDGTVIAEDPNKTIRELCEENKSSLNWASLNGASLNGAILNGASLNWNSHALLSELLNGARFAPPVTM